VLLASSLRLVLLISALGQVSVEVASPPKDAAAAITVVGGIAPGTVRSTITSYTCLVGLVKS
jgi:hypothetical protein